jgi:hypothetical protein
VFNDQEIGFYGWYIDDIAIYTCPRVRPSAASSNG